MFMYYGLADRLNKTVGEVMAIPIAELAGWVAYIEIMNEETEKARKRAERGKG